MHTSRTAAAIALALVTASLTACGGDTATPAVTTTVLVPATTTSAETATATGETTQPTAESATSSSDATTATATPTSASENATPVDPGATTSPSDDVVTTTATTTVTATPTTTAVTRPAVQGEPGGRLTMNGTEYGRDDAAHTKTFLAAMGTPDDTAKRSCLVGGEQVPVSLYRWGGLHIAVVEAQPGGEYGFSYPKGSITGWSISSDAGAGLTGPKGTRIGTPLSELKSRFTKNEWDSVIYEKGTFSIFAGDTTGADWTIGPGEKTVEISSGLTCRRG